MDQCNFLLEEKISGTRKWFLGLKALYLNNSVNLIITMTLIIKEISENILELILTEIELNISWYVQKATGQRYLI